MTDSRQPAGIDPAGTFKPTEAPGPDQLALVEALKFGKGEDLEHDSKRQEHQRHQKFRNHVNKATLGLFWVIVACIALGVLAFAYHLITPASWHWLNEAQRDKLQTLLAAALLSSALTGYVNQRLN